MMSQDKEVEPISVGVHLGNVLKYIAQMHADPFDAIKEPVQNALDKGASRIIIELDQPRDNIRVFDNGHGASRDEITKKFQQIGSSLKLGQEGMFGEKGIGNLAGVSIASESTLVTKDSSDARARFWAYTLSQAQLAKSESIELIPELYGGGSFITKRLDGFGPNGPAAMVQLKGINALAWKRLVNLEALKRLLVNSFASKLRGGKVDIFIRFTNPKGKIVLEKIDPIALRGTRMESVEYTTEFGPVTFEFYCARTPHPNPRLIVQIKRYGIELSNLFMRNQLAKEIAEPFRKGYFEGFIRSEFCELNGQRDALAWNNQAVAFADVVRKFTEEVLAPVVAAFEDEGRQAKYSRISDEILDRVKRLFQSHPELPVPENLKAVLRGGNETPGQKPGPKVTIRPKEHSEPEVRPEMLRECKAEAEKPSRARTKAVAGQSEGTRLAKGLSVAWKLPGKDDDLNWRSRTNQGVIEINCSVADCRAAETLGYKALSAYASQLIICELVCATLDRFSADTFRKAFETTFMDLWRINLQ